MTTEVGIPAGSVALITGGAGGLGTAVATGLAGAGYLPVLMGRTRDKLARAAASLPFMPHTVVADVSSRIEIEHALDAVAELGTPRIVVHAAGIAESAPLLPPDDDIWRRTVHVNLTGAWTIATACLPGMLQSGGGVIVNIGSTAALRGFRYTAAYVASKHGVVGLTRALAEDLANKPVRVHAVCPGFLDTPMTQRTIDEIVETTGRSAREARKIIMNMNASRKLIRPEAVTDLILELVQDTSRHGEVIPIE